MFHTVVSLVVLIGLFMILGYVTFQTTKIIAEELKTRIQMGRRQAFYQYFRFIPSNGQPTRELQARVNLTLRSLADEVHQHHRRWITDTEVMAADAIGWLHEQHFHLAEKEFGKALNLAHEFGFTKRCYVSYLHFLGPQLQEETKLLEVDLRLLRNLN